MKYIRFFELITCQCESFWRIKFSIRRCTKLKKAFAAFVKLIIFMVIQKLTTSDKLLVRYHWIFCIKFSNLLCTFYWFFESICFCYQSRVFWAWSWNNCFCIFSVTNTHLKKNAIDIFVALNDENMNLWPFVLWPINLFKYNMIKMQFNLKAHRSYRYCN